MGKIARYLKKGRWKGGGCIHDVIMEYLVVGVLELEINASRDGKKTHIMTHHIQWVINTDDCHTPAICPEFFAMIWCTQAAPAPIVM
jgi:hypothetical protein